MKKQKESIKIIPLGGLGEVGKNMTLFEYKGKIFILDLGLKFPEEAMPGIDYVIPSVDYLEDKKDKIVGAMISHGHYDHIGAIPYVMDKIGNPPIFASALTRGIIMKRQDDFPNAAKLDIKSVKSGDKRRLGPFQLEFFHENHNIPGNLGVVIKTPVGNIVHTSDFKFDKNPINDKPTDFQNLEKIGKEGVLLLMSDSTGAEEENHSLSEQTISQNLEEIFKKARKNRVVAVTFASLLNRAQQIITLSEKYGRKVVIDGYSMKSNVEIARRLKYLRTKKNTIIKAKDAHKYPDSELTILCTGAQGEGNAVLMRIANKEHRFFGIKKGDVVIFSSSVVPGNERSVQTLKDSLYRQDANVFHYKMMDIHAGGHAQAEELKKMIDLMKPKFFMPVHGQFSMMYNHAEIAEKKGIPQKRIILAENGKVINLNRENFSFAPKMVPANPIMVDGLGIGDVGEIVLRDRQLLSKDGMFVIVVVIDRQAGKVKGSPDIISRGFVYLRESKELLNETRKKVISIVNKATGSSGAVNWVYVKNEIRNKIGDFLHAKTQRRPMVLPVVIEV